jgi:hypothetical protein
MAKTATVTVMPWGMYKGRALDRCPIGYLEYILANVPNLDPALAGAVREEVHRRHVAMATALPPDHPCPDVRAEDDLGGVLAKLQDVQLAQVVLLRWATENRQLQGPLCDSLWDLLASEHALADRLARFAHEPPVRRRALDVFAAGAGVN